MYQEKSGNPGNVTSSQDWKNIFGVAKGTAFTFDVHKLANMSSKQLNIQHNMQCNNL
jgi:hypothetical protein